MGNDAPQPPYRWEAFKHWANLAILGAGTFLGAVHDPLWWVATAGVQVGVLWVIPDMPPWRAFVNKKHRASQLYQERAYFLNQLWGLNDPPEPQGSWLKRLLVEAPPPELNALIRDRRDPACRDYLEMCDIVHKLSELRQVPGVSLSQTDIDRFDVIVNGYLRMLFACRPIEAALRDMDPRRLEREVQQIAAELPDADAAVKVALTERLRIARNQLERYPKLQATLQLYRSRSSDMVHQLRNLQGQVLANPTADVHTMLDDMASQQEMLADPLGHIAADQLVRELMEDEDRKKARSAAAERARTH